MCKNLIFEPPIYSGGDMKLLASMKVVYLNLRMGFKYISLMQCMLWLIFEYTSNILKKRKASKRS